MAEFLDRNYLWPAPSSWRRSCPRRGAAAGGGRLLTYAERKVIAAIQLRKGPNVVGPVRVCCSPSPTA